MKVHLEYLGEDRLFPGAKRWKVEALHVTTTRNKRKFTLSEMRTAGRSLSYRPLNLNHDHAKGMPYPENCTEACHFNENRMAIDCIFRVSDPAVNAMIESNRINAVSIEQIPTLGESCDQISCEQHGVAFIGMALLESSVPPGDKDATGIARVESVQEEKLGELLVSDAQRTCHECTDFEACHTCKHTVEKGEKDIIANLEKIIKPNNKLTKDEILGKAICDSGLGNSLESAWWWYHHMAEKFPAWVN